MSWDSKCFDTDSKVWDRFKGSSKSDAGRTSPPCEERRHIAIDKLMTVPMEEAANMLNIQSASF